MPEHRNAASAREPAGTGHGRRQGRGTAPSEEPDGLPTRRLFRGLRAGDLECVLLTVAMAAEENRMPSADPDEAARILAFLERLAEHDDLLPQRPGRAGAPLEGPPPEAGRRRKRRARPEVSVGA